MKKRTVYNFLIVLFAAFSLLWGLTPNAIAYNDGIHQHLGYSSLDLLEKYYPNAEVLGYQWWFADGCVNEDHYNHNIYCSNYGASCRNGNNTFGECTVNHFWSADGGVNDFVTLDGVIGEQYNAFQKASGMGLSSCSTGLWQWALEAYQLGDTESAYHYLGHMAHLIGDMSVPAHVHEDAHPTADCYEDKINNFGWSIFAGLDQKQLDQGLFSIPPPCGSDPVWGEAEYAQYWPLFYLFYTTNQRADFFGSEDIWGNDTALTMYYDQASSSCRKLVTYEEYDPQMYWYQNRDHMKCDGKSQWICYCKTYDHWEFECIGCDTCGDWLGPCPGAGWQRAHITWLVAQRYLLPHAERAVATLLYLFGRAVGDPGMNSAPVANAGVDQTVEADGNCQASVTLDGSLSSDFDSTFGTSDDIVSFQWYEGPTLLGYGQVLDYVFGFGNHHVTLITEDKFGSSDTDELVIDVIDTTSPSLYIPVNITAECSGPEGSSVDLGQAAATDNCCSAITISNDAPARFVLGDAVVTWTAEDCHGNSSVATQTVSVIDTQPPDFTVSVSPSVLWPPNHEMMEVVPSVLVADHCCASDVIIELVSVTTHEADRSNASGRMLGQNGDVLIDGGRIYLRAERAGLSRGRSYTITYQATDCHGNISTASTTVAVPHDRSWESKK
jgi:hypothetical protein